MPYNYDAQQSAGPLDRRSYTLDSIDTEDWSNYAMDNCLTNQNLSSAQYRGESGQPGNTANFQSYWMREFNPKLMYEKNKDEEDVILEVNREYLVDL